MISKHLLVLLFLGAGFCLAEEDLASLKARRDRLDRLIIRFERGAGSPHGQSMLSSLGREIWDARMVKPQGYSLQTQWRNRLSVPVADLTPAALPEGAIRGVAEVVLPADSAQLERQAQRLAAWRKAGYDAIVFVWEPGKVNSLSATTVFLSMLRGSGWRILLTWEDPPEGAYFNPDLLAALLRETGPFYDAVIPLWRTRDAESWGSLDKASSFVAVVSAVIREQCPEMPIFGHVYLTPQFEVLSVVPKWACGALVTNVGFSGCNPFKLKELLNKAVGEMPLLVLVNGPTPYYATYNRREQFVDEAQVTAIKMGIAERFALAGMHTVTLFGDGSGGVEVNGRTSPDKLVEQAKSPVNKRKEGVE